MKKFLWCLFTRKSVKEDKEITKLIRKCIHLLENCSSVNIKIDQYYINIETDSYNIKLWNENKFFGWLSQGSINEMSYRNQSPSKSAMYDLKICLERLGYSIYT